MVCACCSGCENDEDCYYYLVSVSGYDEPGCGAEYLYAWFNSYEAAEEYALPFLEDEDCGAPVIDSATGLCCDNECYPSPDDLPFFTNLEPGELTCTCYCTCNKREAGTTFAYLNLDNGCEECCPPGSTWDGEVCADDETNAVVALDSHEGWSQCGDYCIPVGEECPP